MVNVRTTLEFDTWFLALSGTRAYTKVVTRMRNMGQGNFGDCKAVGNGLSESRINYGPGYRLYFVRDGREVVLLLAGGDKSTQRRDIMLARRLAAEL